jgi:hypothetical protein
MNRSAVRILIGVGVGIAAGFSAFVWINRGSNETAVADELSNSNAPVLSYRPSPIGDPAAEHPVIAHVTIVDLDEDSLPDIVVCDALSNSVRWIRQFPRDTFTERQIGSTVQAPVHATLADLNGDKRLDVLVASMGVLLPNNDRIGSVVVLENLGGGRFQNRVIQDNLTRVTDVRAADINGDRHPDLIVGQFGYFEGHIQWMENLGDWQFKNHLLLTAPGTIHTPVADFDGDGLPDFAALVAQDAEEVRIFRNRGDAAFEHTVVWKSLNPSWASSGLEVGDVNRDGRPDLIFSNGDGFEGFVGVVPWHGLHWLENRENGFRSHSIGSLPGCYSPALADLDGDGDPDIVAVSGFNNWRDPQAVSMMAWLNDGHEAFQPVVLAHTPTHLIAVAAGDLDGDGTPELVTGGFHVYPPWQNMSRVTLWKRR